MRKAALLLLVAAVLRAGAPAAEERTAGLVALTFDDGPTGELTGELLDGLREREIPATFFLCGYRIRQFPELVRRMAEEGHEPGVHGMSHP